MRWIAVLGIVGCLVGVAAAENPEDLIVARKNAESVGTTPTRAPCPAPTAAINCGDTVAVDTTTASNTMSGYSCTTWNESGPERVYSLTLPAGGPWDITATIANIVGGDLDVFIMSDPCDSDNCLGYGNTAASALDVTGGATVYVSVDGYGTASGTADLTIACQEPLPAPPNDACATATVVNADPFTDLQDFAQATADLDTSCNLGTTETSFGIWYSYTPQASGTVTIDRGVNGYVDTIAAVFTGTCAGLTEVNCADAESTTFDVTAGTTYYILIGRWGSTAPTIPVGVSISGVPVPVELMSLDIH